MSSPALPAPNLPAFSRRGTAPAIAAATPDLEVLLIVVGEQVLAVPLDQVHHITEMPKEFAAGSDGSRYFVYSDKPLNYVSLWDEFQRKSRYSEYEELLTSLPLRCQDHLDWIGALEESIRSGAPFTKARNPRECAFGKWYYSYRPNDQHLAAMLRQFDSPHAEIHALADSLLNLVHAGGDSEALATLEYVRSTTLANLIHLFESTESLLEHLIRRVVILVGGAEPNCALGADGIREIVRVEPARLTRFGNTDGDAVCGLLILDDGSVASLMNWRSLCPALRE